MLITKTDLSTLEITPITAKPIININYNLIERSDKKFTSIDRGESTDGYASSMVFEGDAVEIDELYVQLELLRKASTQVVLSEFGESYFGDHVDHTIPIDCVVAVIEDLSSPMLRVKKIEVTFLSTDVSYTGNNTLPSLLCLEQGWSGFNEWSFNLSSTYNRNNFFADRETDIYVFTGKYRLTKEENRDLFTFWRNQRGASFTADDGDFGVECMFGPNDCDTSHDVVIESISYDPLGPVVREVSITLFKTGGSAVQAPLITVQPVDWTGSAGDTATFGPIAYSGSASAIQWYKDSVLLTGETALTLERENIGLSYFEAPPFAGSVGSPVTTDSNWVLTSGGSGNGVEYEGDYATALDSNSQNNLYDCIHSGDVVSYFSDCTGAGNFGANPWLKGAINANANTWVQCQWIGSSAYVSAYINGTEKGVTVVSVGQSATIDSRMTIEIDISGSSATIESKFYNPSGTMITSDVSTWSDGYDTTQSYYPIIFSYNNDVRYDLIRIEGVGFPSEIGDPFDTEYYATVTNTAGSDTSDTVTTMEAI